MVKTTFVQKILLLLFSLILIILFIELGFGSLVLSTFQKTANLAEGRSLFESPDKIYTILTIGESTTAGTFSTWPIFLEQILNNRSSKKKFRVYNGGAAAVDTIYLVGKIRGNIERYSPDMVISMMGVNDGQNYVKYSEDYKIKILSFIKQLKTYRLCKYITRYLSNYYDKPIRTKGREASELTVIQLNYSDIPFYYNLSLEYFRLGKLDTAEEIMRAIINIAPRNGAYFTFLGNILHSEHRRQEARKFFQDALQINNKDYDAYVGLAWGYFEEERDLKKSEELFRYAISINPGKDGAYAGLGVLYKSMEKSEEAEKMFQEAVKINPANTLAMTELGHLYFSEGRKIDAVFLYEKVIELNNRTHEVYSLLGLYYYGQKNFEKAEKMYKLAIMQKPDDDDSVTHLGWIYREIGRINDSEAMLKKSLEINPDRGGSALSLAYLNSSDVKSRFEKYLDIPVAIAYNISGYDLIGYHYRALWNILDGYGIKYAAMQYPTLDIGTIRGYFNEEARNKIIFISNEETFNKTQENGSYNDYFEDNFGMDREDGFPYKGNFGHATIKGNKLIAENAARAVFEYLNITG